MNKQAAALEWAQHKSAGSGTVCVIYSSLARWQSAFADARPRSI